MKDREEIKVKLVYEKKIENDFKGSPEGSLEYERWIIANNLINVLEWVLDD